jgi:glycine C-acetyltransferase
MPNQAFHARCGQTLADLEAANQRKRFYYLDSPMGATARLEDGREVIVLCSNNYLGLANHREVVAAGEEGLRRYGAGTASVRFICGSFSCHLEIEREIAEFVGTEAALSYVSCWNANEALFATLATADDVILSDSLNHASIIDGIRLCGKKVAKEVYPHADLDALEGLLQQHADKQCRWVVTDGVFSMEGDVAPLPQLAELCRRYEAMLIVDDSHGIGVLGSTGRGTPEHFDMVGNVDVLTGTLGKALGGGAGGYIAGSQRAVDVLEQRGRPSLFSNALPATIACSARQAIEVVRREPQRVAKLHANVAQLREGLARLGFECPESPTAIVPIMLGDAAETYAKSQRLMELGVMVIGFWYPVVPQGEARLRVQVSAALEPEHLQQALDAFAKL